MVVIVSDQSKYRLTEAAPVFLVITELLTHPTCYLIQIKQTWLFYLYKFQYYTLFRSLPMSLNLFHNTCFSLDFQRMQFILLKRFSSVICVKLWVVASMGMWNCIQVLKYYRSCKQLSSIVCILYSNFCIIFCPISRKPVKKGFDQEGDIQWWRHWEK